MRDFALEVHFSQWEFRAKHHLTASDVESMSISELLSMGTNEDREEFERCSLGYTETWGAPDLRAAIAQTYCNLVPEHILCFAGAEEGIYASMRALLAKDDHVIVTVPNYQAAETVPLSFCDVSGIPLREENGWRLDIDALAGAIKRNTKLVSIDFPNNPTGAIMPRPDFDALIAICRNHDLYLFSDEVYRLLESDDTKRLPQVADVYERGLSVNVMSKAYGLPGLRVGWIASQDKAALIRLERYKHYLSICNAAPSERLAKVALSARNRILERNRALIRSNLAVLETFFSEFEEIFEWYRPDGGCVAYPRFAGNGGVESFCHDLLNEEGVLLLPASIFRSELLETPTDRFRIGYGRKGMEQGLAALRTFLLRHHDDLIAR